MKKYYIIIFILLLAIIGETLYIFNLKKSYSPSNQINTSIIEENIVDEKNENSNNETPAIDVNLSQADKEPENETEIPDLENLITYTNTPVEAPETIDEVNFPSTYTLDKVIVSIKNGTLSKSGLTLVIKDLNMTEPVFTENYKLLYQAGNIWAVYPPINPNYTFSDELIFGDDNIFEQKIEWRDIYGELPAGTYKLEKTEKINGENLIFSSPIFNIK